MNTTQARTIKTLKLLTALRCYNASTLLNIYGNMCLVTKYTKIHPKGMATFKKNKVLDNNGT